MLVSTTTKHHKHYKTLVNYIYLKNIGHFLYQNNKIHNQFAFWKLLPLYKKPVITNFNNFCTFLSSKNSQGAKKNFVENLSVEPSKQSKTIYKKTEWPFSYFLNQLFVKTGGNFLKICFFDEFSGGKIEKTVN